MRPHFKTGTEISTSSSVESLFAEYKTRLFKGCIPMRVDKFVASHLNYLDGRVFLDYVANIFSTQQECKTSLKNNDIHEDIHNDTHKDKSEQYSEFSSNSYIDTSVSSNINDNLIVNSSFVNSIIDSSCNIQNNSKASDLIYSISEDNVSDPLNFQENWKGLVNKNIQKCSNIKKKLYLDKCPE